MTRKLRFRIGLAVFAVLGVLALAGLAAPHVVDVEKYKPAIVASVKAATGRELVIEGPMKLQVFPQPRISARKVHFANAVGGKGAQMVDVAWIGISPSLWALLQGKVEVGRLTLYKPVIVLETDANGVPNWEFNPGAGAAQPAGAESSGLHLAVGQLRIRQGTLSYTNPKTGQTLKIENLDGTASVGSLEGPFSLDATATVNGVPLSLVTEASAPTEKGNELSFKLKVQTGTLDFAGRISRIGPGADINGKVAIATGSLTEFISAMIRATGQPVPAFSTAVAGQFSFTGGIDLTAERLALNDFKMSMGGETVTGSIELNSGANPSLKSRLAMPKLDVERWVELLSRPAALTAPQPASATAPAVAPAKPAAAPAAPKPPAQAAAPAAKPAPVLSPFPAAFAVSLDVEAKEVVYRKQTVRDVALGIEIAKGVITVPRLAATLPGDMVLRANAVQPAGEFSLTGSKLRETLAWLGIDVSGVPKDKLQTLQARGKVVPAASNVQVSDLVLELDGQRATGTAALTAGTPLTIATTLQLDQFDLDAYTPQPAASASLPQLTLPPALPAVTPAAPKAVAAPDPTAPVLGLKAKVAKLAYRGATLAGIETDLAVQGNLLKLNALKVGDLLGAKFDLKGQVADFGSDPRFDVTFNATMPDTDKVAVFAGLPKFIGGKMGASRASGSVAGTLEALTLRNASVTMAGATVQASGSLVLGDNFAFDLPTFSVQAAEAGGLVSLATGQPQGGLGALQVSGAFKGNDQRASFDGSLAALGTQMNGRLDATLGKRPNVTANLRIPGTLDLDQWLGVADGPPPPTVAPIVPAAQGNGAAAPPVAAPQPRAATGKAIDLSAFRAFDATISLETSAIEVASLTVTYGDLEATLRNGVLKVSKLTGQFYGGAVDFTGTVDASKDTLVVDMDGTLRGIYLGQLLRGSTGNNNFGNDQLTIALDGKIDVLEMALNGQGNTPEQIRDSLNGRGRLSGYIYPSVMRGSLGLATFATGVASIFSSEMGFASSALSAFINGQNAVQGEITLQGGVLTLHEHTVQGQNAVARINSRTNLNAATTDTTISLGAGTQAPADYVMTVKGPVSAPVLATGRGH